MPSSTLLPQFPWTKAMAGKPVWSCLSSVSQQAAFSRHDAFISWHQHVLGTDTCAGTENAPSHARAAVPFQTQFPPAHLLQILQPVSWSTKAYKSCRHPSFTIFLVKLEWPSPPSPKPPLMCHMLAYITTRTFTELLGPYRVLSEESPSCFSPNTPAP